MKPEAWTNLTLPNPNLDVRKCTNLGCGEERSTPIQFPRHSLPSGTATYDLSVTLTNSGNVSMFVEGSIRGSGSPIDANNLGSPIGFGICNPPSRGVEAGATVTYSCRVQGKATAHPGLVYTTRAVTGQELVTPHADVTLTATATRLRVLSDPA